MATRVFTVEGNYLHPDHGNPHQLLYFILSAIGTAFAVFLLYRILGASQIGFISDVPPLATVAVTSAETVLDGPNGSGLDKHRSCSEDSDRCSQAELSPDRARMLGALILFDILASRPSGSR